MEDWTTYAWFSGLGLMLALEVLRPGRTLGKQPLWRLRGVLSFALTFAVTAYVPLAWDDTLYAHQMFDARSLGTVGGAAVGLLVYELLAYAWHRAMHRVDFLFRTFHQAHHSVERMDVWGAFTFHPLDAAGFTLVGSLAMVLVVGVTVEAALLAGLVINLLAAFGHANLRTPRWLGYFVSRPEQHAVHHERGVHAHNYADLPVVDLIFGTFRNPARFEGETGYYDGASLRVADILVGRDVTRQPDAAQARPSTPSAPPAAQVA